MASYITPCFSDWQQETFRRGIMAIVNGKRSDREIRRLLRADDREGIRWYRKADPDFDHYTYSRCHRTLRRALLPDDIVFFRTLWRGHPYIIGYFTVRGFAGPPDDPIVMASPNRSRLIHYRLPVTPRIVRRLNPRARSPGTRPLNQWTNEQLGRNWMRLDRQVAVYLKTRIDARAASE